MTSASEPDCSKQLRRLLERHEELPPQELIRALVALSETFGPESAARALEESPELFDYAPVVRSAHHPLIIASEGKSLESLLSRSPAEGLSVLRGGSEGSRIVYDRVREVFTRVDFTRCERFVMIGCGRVPTTLLHVHDRTEVPELIGLDIRPEAIEGARALVDRFGLSRVRAELSDGTAFDYSTADVIYMANMVSPKRDVLVRIADTARPDVQIVVREPFGLARLWSDRAEETLDPRIAVTAYGALDTQNLTRDVFMRLRQET